MPSSAKKSSLSPKEAESRRQENVRAALQHLKDGGKPTTFAKDHGLARTTVSGWCKDHAGPRGRPQKKLNSKDVTAVLKELAEGQSFQTCETFQKCFCKASGESLDRHSILRLLTQLGLGLNAETPNAGDPMLISSSKWIQPPETLDGNGPARRATIWRVLHGRGMACFMLTDDDSAAAVETVATAFWEQYKCRKRRRQLRTNHPGLAKVLREKLKGWRVETAVE